MAAMFGHSWLSQYGPAPDGVGGDTWSAVLADLSPQQIGAGLQSLSRIPSDWPPTAPRFRALCLSIPTIAECRIELRAGNPDPSPFARLLWSYVDGYRYRQSSADVADRMLREAYELATAFVMDGGALPAPSAAIEQDEPPKPKPADPEVARRAMDEIARRLGMGDPEPETARTIQGDFAQLERESEPDFRRLAAGDH
jgi:hypothetical protein